MSDKHDKHRNPKNESKKAVSKADKGMKDKKSGDEEKIASSQASSPNAAKKK